MLNFLQQYGYIAIFLALLLENTIVVGVFFPGIAVLVAAGYFAGTGDLNPIAVFAVSWAAVICGDTLGYMVGRFGIHRFRIVHKLLKENQQHAERLAATRSPLLLLFQFPMPTRTAIPVIAGSIRVKVVKWLLLDAAATTLFATSVLSVGYLSGRAAGALDEAQQWADRIQILFIGLFVMWLAIIIVKWLQWRRKRAMEKSNGGSGRASSVVMSREHVVDDHK